VLAALTPVLFDLGTDEPSTLGAVILVVVQALGRLVDLREPLGVVLADQLGDELGIIR